MPVSPNKVAGLLEDAVDITTYVDNLLNNREWVLKYTLVSIVQGQSYFRVEITLERDITILLQEQLIKLYKEAGWSTVTFTSNRIMTLSTYQG